MIPPLVREAAIYSLSKIGCKDGAAFFEALDDPNEAVRKAAANSLGWMKWNPENEEQRKKYVQARYRAEVRWGVNPDCFFCKSSLQKTVQPQSWIMGQSPKDAEASLLGRTEYDAEICFHCLTVGCIRCVRGKTCKECGQKTEKANAWKLRELAEVAYGIEKREDL